MAIIKSGHRNEWLHSPQNRAYFLLYLGACHQQGKFPSNFRDASFPGFTGKFTHQVIAPIYTRKPASFLGHIIIILM
jgi:hypothetical protein